MKAVVGNELKVFIPLGYKVNFKGVMPWEE